MAFLTNTSAHAVRVGAPSWHQQLPGWISGVGLKKPGSSDTPKYRIYGFLYVFMRFAGISAWIHLMARNFALSSIMFIP